MSRPVFDWDSNLNLSAQLDMVVAAVSAIIFLNYLILASTNPSPMTAGDALYLFVVLATTVVFSWMFKPTGIGWNWVLWFRRHLRRLRKPKFAAIPWWIFPDASIALPPPAGNPNTFSC